MRVCEVCGNTSERTLIKCYGKTGQILCQKHYNQMRHRGCITDPAPSKPVPIKVCEVCGATSETKTIFRYCKTGQLLCNRHKKQFDKYGYFIDESPISRNDENEYVLYDDYAEIILLNKKHIEIGRVLIDLEDVERCKQYKWHLDNKGYAITAIRGTRTTTLLIHRLILDYSGELDVDHINRNKLDNRKENLRIVNRAMNIMNNGSKHIYYDEKRKLYYGRFMLFGYYFYTSRYIEEQKAIEELQNLHQKALLNVDELEKEYLKRKAETTPGISFCNNKYRGYFRYKGKTIYTPSRDTMQEAVDERLSEMKKRGLPV